MQRQTESTGRAPNGGPCGRHPGQCTTDGSVNRLVATEGHGTQSDGSMPWDGRGGRRETQGEGRIGRRGRDI